jgi:hypothetical protein
MEIDPDQLPMQDLGIQCRRCAYPLRGLSGRRCPECGWQFAPDDLIPPGDWPVVTFHNRAIRATPNVIAVLRAARILNLADDALSSIYGMTGGISNRAQPLRVPRQDYFRALRVLVLAAGAQNAVLRADLPYGLDDTEPRRDDPPRPDWACNACGELNPGTFDMCWNCPVDASRDTDCPDNAEGGDDARSAPDGTT